MARDRKRAKQRQRRRAGQPQAQRQPQPQRVPADGEQTGAPAPLDHVSAAEDLVDAVEAAGDEGPAAELAPEEAPQPDELDSAADALDEGSDALAGDRFARRRGAGGTPAKPAGSALPKSGNRFVNFLRACIAELGRVQWPDRRAVTQATGVVLGFVIIAGAYLGLLDAVFSRLVKQIL
jgi:preprotein translocase subunit SecE